MKKWLITLGVLILIIGGGLIGAGAYFYHVAIARGDKAFITQSTKLSKKSPVYREKYWYAHVKKQTWQIESHDHLKLVAWYIPKKGATKTVVLAHGFAGNKSLMGAWAGMYHELGYNVLVPDARAAGASQGSAIGYGWLERRDDLQWAKTVVKKTKTTQIVMSGISMGAAGMTMASGEKQLPQIKAYVVDSPFTSAKDIISYQAKQLYHLPAFPLVDITSAITKLRAGYTFGEADAVAQIEKNHQPIMIISGTKDEFVPTRMAKKLYRNAHQPKQLWLVKGAAHTTAITHDYAAYKQHVKTFLAKYVK
ncbi:alpha/beta hydrolase [Lactiplantibacillus mudanjiangensis]|uniref:Alpha/beta hydrolase [Lactobacillus pentosus] n=1 Tax=Lactiplantibacillus mudanjiangensis TaxID=1296538 RepID=A0A660E3E2_9LACO|nr:alpha/beta hydrolase [Lactiplantibacillus mudanjiangensis]VDG18949.1 alpha/beta hydrolase [Lactobacillus pentosus] [Lactiplantibacillus mudanjiangensis]VDG25274.1 alpha/beta hydrolase [Lactobacillus pentosus] [Lactiplantibacillus mudanjiangensis]VDG27473.1 alpha/beta hydrolase [Lactobacillus pentosus] [Lactiplantibacillus mudanjiangensis]VDG33050.1 alpha/beta hydrolase [Lactobacillus pentosus] [Lactiplantibacillus mudanjiangensis]